MKIQLEYDLLIDIAIARSRMSKKWTNRRWRWSELLERCKETRRTDETAAEYARMSREEQSDIKDVGGFVGGYLSQGLRKKANVMYRTVATLDIDYGTPDVWNDFTMSYGFAAMIYSTHKHNKEHPRYRLVFPLSRQVKPAEYEPLCRKIASEIGIDLFDDTTYELPRLFYWPSTSKDAEYVFDYQDGPPCDVDKILAQYVDPFDASAWPMSSRESDVAAHEIKKAGDPTEKPGLIGAFCRAYSIEDAIARFLADVYEPTAASDRYTYKLGSVAGGLVCYEGKYAYSHHETDPAGRKLCNAFDLCRIHLFGAKDEGSRAQDVTRKPSYQAMAAFAAADRNVKLLMARERLRSAAEDFDSVKVPKGYTDEWKADLEYTKSGKLLCSMSNIILILEKDPALAGKIYCDQFSGFNYTKGDLPWNPKAGAWSDRDDANLRVWLEKNYGLTGKDKIADALTAVLTRHSLHPVREYLDSLVWDGTPRLERLIIDYIGAADTEINRAMTRKHFVAAVGRIYKPGIKYDQCLILTGPEGAGKSTLLSIMGGKWFNDSVTTMEGKEGMDQLRSSWIIELGELSSVKRSDVESVKAFLSKRTDIYRAAYDRRSQEHPRQCVFCGTTNEVHFLKGDTGNRRFWVIFIEPHLRRHNKWYKALTRDRNQLWAEAVAYWKQGESLYLGEDLESQARKIQSEYNDDNDDPMRDMLVTFLDAKLPPDWATWNLDRRRAFIKNPAPLDAEGTETRTRICVAEFICEVLGKERSDKDYRYVARRVGKYISELPDWEHMGASKHASKLYGVQKAFKRVTKLEEEGDL